jgi:uncharacterized protein YxjI
MNDRATRGSLFHRQLRPDRYMMRQKLVAFGDDFHIDDEQGRCVCRVDGKVLRVRDTLNFQAMDGTIL